MDLLKSLNIIGSLGVLDCGYILKERVNKGFVHSFLCLLVVDFEVAPDKAKGIAGFLDDGINMGIPLHIVLYGDAKVLCGVDVFQGLSMQLIHWGGLVSFSCDSQC